MIHAFGEYVLDAASYEIRRSGALVPVEPQVFDVILYLVEHRDRVVSKEELLDNVWGDRFVSESALTSRIKAARRVLGDDGTTQAVIRTAHGRGYRFVGAVTTDHAASRQSPTDREVPEWQTLPAPVTSFVGRAAERAALVDALAANRMVTAVGPGGIGKTRLALSVAAEIAPTRRDGAWFVDLVNVTDPTMVTATIADAVGVPEQRATSIDAALLASLERRDGLLVVDNCEHLLDGARTAIGRILARCPGVTILATSRIRLMTPYEHVYAVPGLSVHDDGGDALDLFTTRAEHATGRPERLDAHRVASLCRALDGMALAIELAAARYPTLGLDGLEEALEHRLRVLAAGVLGDRHGSLRDAIAWSYDLLGPADQQLLRGLSVFASWFDVDAARAVAAPAQARAVVADALGRLADHSLLVVQHGAPTRYRALETIRQFGSEHLEAADQLREVRERHESWCRAVAVQLAVAAPDEAWCEQFDRLVDDLRAALLWASADDGRRDDAARFAAELAALLFLRGRTREAQLRFEQAAALTAHVTARLGYLRLAAGAATSRYVGDDALRLLRAAATEALADGDRSGAARDLSMMAMYIVRSPGIIAEEIPLGTAGALLGEAAAASDGSTSALAAIASADAFVQSGGSDVLELTQHAVELAHEAGDLVLESAALDQLTAVHLARGDIRASLAVQERRRAVIEALPVAADSGFEHSDFCLMTSEVFIAAGDIVRARVHADALADLPFHRDDDHLGVARRLKVDALAGHFDAVVGDGERFRLAWERAGRPVVRNLGTSAYAVAMVHGMLGDDDERARWRRITVDLGPSEERIAGCTTAWAPTFDALLALHRGDPAAALERLALDIDDETFGEWNVQLWRPWYAAAWAEATVLDGRRDAPVVIARARRATQHNPISRTVVERAAALLRGDLTSVLRCAPRFAALACPYQEARTAALVAAPR